jgi:hypothetical protein
MRRSNSFEVVVESQGRPQIDGVFDAEANARERAAYLLSQAKYGSVRVVKVDARGGSVVVFEKNYKGTGKTVTVGNMEDAPICDTVLDVFGYPARKALGRVMRPWCDEQSLIPLEALHKPIMLRQIEREDVLHNQLINRVASVQAKKYRMGQDERADHLRRLYAAVFNMAKAAETDLAYWGLLIRREGFNAVAKQATEDLPAHERCRAVTYALAQWIDSSRDWPQKLDGLTELFTRDMTPEAVNYLDEAISEILDGPTPIRAILGYAPDLGSALIALGNLAKGSFDERHGRSPPFERLNWLIDRWGLPLCRATLLSRIARTLDGTTPLTKTGKVSDAQTFRKLLGLIREVGGFKGGPSMCSAVTRRAQTAFGGDYEDLPVEEAVSMVSDGMPDAAARIGYLLDLLGSEFGHRRATYLTKQLANIFTRMSSIRDLFAGQPDAWKSQGVRDSFRERLYNGGIRRDLADLLLHRIELLAQADEATAAAAAAAKAGAAKPLIEHTIDPDVVKTVCYQIEVLSDIPKAKGPQLLLFYQGAEIACGTDIGEFVMGRSSECNLKVAAKTASRRHAVVRSRQGEFVLVDLSRNGTYVRTGGQKPKVLHGSSATLSGSGSIYLGADPNGEDVDKSHLILYQYVK